MWYDGSQVHPRLHQTHVRPLLEGQVSVRPLRSLTHSLRAIKSPAEVELMKQAGRITAQVRTYLLVYFIIHLFFTKERIK